MRLQRALNGFMCDRQGVGVGVRRLTLARFIIVEESQDCFSTLASSILPSALAFASYFFKLRKLELIFFFFKQNIVFLRENFRIPEATSYRKTHSFQFQLSVRSAYGTSVEIMNFRRLCTVLC